MFARIFKKIVKLLLSVKMSLTFMKKTVILVQFHEFLLHIFLFVIFNTANTVRWEMWVHMILGFQKHSYQNFLTHDFDKIFWHLWYGNPRTQISSSQYSLFVFAQPFHKRYLTWALVQGVLHWIMHNKFAGA